MPRRHSLQKIDGIKFLRLYLSRMTVCTYALTALDSALGMRDRYKYKLAKPDVIQAS